MLFAQKTSRNTWGLLLTWVFVITSSNISFAYEVDFHHELTELTIQNSKLSTYLNENLMFGLSEQFLGPGFWVTPIFITRTVQDWITYGSWREDNPIGWRAVHHFENPVAPAYGYERYLTDLSCPDGISTEPSALDRAENADDNWEGYSWEDAKEYYYLALTSQNKAARDKYFAMTFRAVGQVLHLLQDMGTPAHVRNDSHVLPGFYGTETEIRGKDSVLTTEHASGFKKERKGQ